jgi:CSLREA domain-containing protein
MTRRALRLTVPLIALAALAVTHPASAQTCTATVTVRSTADTAGVCPGAACTLRQAILDANASPDCTRIHFDFAPAAGGTIALASPLPTITTPVELDGFSHPDSRGFPESGVTPQPVFTVVIAGHTNNVAGSGLRFLDAGYGLVRGLQIHGFLSGAAVEVAASTNAPQNVTIRENILGRVWQQPPTAPTNRVGVSVQARGVHVGGGLGDYQPPEIPGFQVPHPLDQTLGNWIAFTTGPGVHVTTSAFGIQGRARVIGNFFSGYADMFGQLTGPLPIDLGPEGRTPNDPGDGDAGPNDLQNFPIVTYEPIRIGEDPGAPACTAASGYATCNALRVHIVLEDAPAGTYTAEVFAGGIDPLSGDNGNLQRFFLTGVRSTTGSGDLDVRIDLGQDYQLVPTILGLLRAGSTMLPRLYGTISQEGEASVTGATSEFSDGGGSGSQPPVEPPPVYTRYFAEGASGSFFDTTFSLSNFGQTAAAATLTFHTDGGQAFTRQVTVPAGGRPVMVQADAVAGLDGASFGTTITADQLLVASRTMTWDQTGYGSHADNGAPAARTRWFLAEGVTGAFDTYVLVYNPTPDPATLSISVNRIAPLAPIVRTYTLAGRRRLTIAVDGVDPGLAATDVAIDVTSTNGTPVVVERSVYLSSSTTVYEAGTGSTAGDVGTRWYFGEGAATATFDTFLLFYNPNLVAANIEVRYLRRSGAPVVRSYVVAAQSRLSIWTDLTAGLDDQDFGMVVTATNDVPIAVERAMWGGGQAFIDGHASPGMATPSIRWGLSGGEVNLATAADTYVLIVNPTTTPAVARLTLFYEDGTASTPVTVPVPAERRANASLAGLVPSASGRRFSILVESVGTGTPPLIVERSTYTSPGALWRAGSNEPGTPLP